MTPARISEIPLNALQRIMVAWNVGTCTEYILSEDETALDKHVIRACLKNISKSVKILNECSVSGVNCVMLDKLQKVEVAKSEKEVDTMIKEIDFSTQLSRIIICGKKLFICISLAISDPKMMQILGVLLHNEIKKDDIKLKNMTSNCFFPIMPIPIDSVIRCDYRPFMIEKKFHNKTAFHRFEYDYSTIKQIVKVYDTNKLEYIMISSIVYALVDVMKAKGHTTVTVSNLSFLQRCSEGSEVRYNSSVSFASLPVDVTAYRGPSERGIKKPSNIIETTRALLESSTKKEAKIGGYYSFLLEQSTKRLSELESPESFRDYVTVEFCYCPELSKKVEDYHMRWIGLARNTLSILAIHQGDKIEFSVSICEKDTDLVDIRAFSDLLYQNIESQRPLM